MTTEHVATTEHVTSMLRTEDLTVRFGGLTALNGVNLTVEQGTITGLIGPNGAGKTTLFNVLTGLARPTKGRVYLEGSDITGLNSAKRARLGMGRTFQRLELFLSLSVRDNLRVATDVRDAGRRRRTDPKAEIDQVLELTGLARIADREVADIPTGQARVVEVARALLARPRVLLLDEPASGQTEAETEAFGTLLRRLAEDGLTICLVEHDLGLVMKVCSQIHVLDYGVVLASGTPEAIRQNPDVITAYIGTTAEGAA